MLKVKFGLSKKGVAAALPHKVTADLRKILSSNPKVGAAWEDLTPLARNEWICWIVSNKKPETRTRHLERTRAELLAGKRRPCCFAGCIHRRKNKIIF
jgi:uncharacterized protein YdeI (YjbR/CyaY-like superfamily)